MPSLIRFLVILAVIGGLVLGAMVALVTFVEPQDRDMTQSIPANRLKP